MARRTAKLAALVAAGLVLFHAVGCSGGSSASTRPTLAESQPPSPPAVSRCLVLSGSHALATMPGSLLNARNDETVPPVPGIPDLASATFIEFRRYDRLGITSSGRPTQSTRYYGREIDRTLLLRDR